MFDRLAEAAGLASGGGKTLSLGLQVKPAGASAIRPVFSTCVKGVAWQLAWNLAGFAVSAVLLDTTTGACVKSHV